MLPILTTVAACAERMKAGLAINPAPASPANFRSERRSTPRSCRVVFCSFAGFRVATIAPSRSDHRLPLAGLRELTARLAMNATDHDLVRQLREKLFPESNTCT